MAVWIVWLFSSEGPLGLDQGDELIDRIDVAGFEIILEERAGALIARCGIDRWAGGFGFLVEISAEELQALWVDELGHFELSEVCRGGRAGL